MTYVTSGCLGVDFTATPTAAGFVIGTQVMGSDGTKWVYVQASGAITQYDAVAIDENYQAASMTKALADAGHQVGFAQVAFADNDYGWIALEGSNISVRVAPSCAADVALYTTGSSGVLDDTSASQTKIEGAVIVAAGTSAANSAREVIATRPYAAQPA